jgi:hypothetical protein
MTKIEITSKELEDQIRAIAQENPDTIYDRPVRDNVGNTSCLYFDLEGNPSCLIGQGFARLGFEADDFVNSENMMEISELLNTWQAVSFGDTAWLRCVQFAQDEGATWSDAVQKADWKTGVR